MTRCISAKSSSPARTLRNKRMNPGGILRLAPPDNLKGVFAPGEMKHGETAMKRLTRANLVTVSWFLAILLCGPLLAAQVDLSGYWAVRIQEDQTWRGPGSDLGEYQG